MIYNVMLLSLHSESVGHSESVIHRKDFFIGAFQLVKNHHHHLHPHQGLLFPVDLVSTSRGRVLSRDP